MKTITLYETIEELKNHLIEMEFKGIKEEKHSTGKTWIIYLENFIFKDEEFRGHNIFQCSSIHKNDIVFYDEKLVEYLLWDDWNCDFYTIKDEKLIEKIEKYLS